MRSSAAFNLAGIGLGALGVALGLSQGVHGFYDEATWAWIAIGALVVLLTVAIGMPRRIALGGVLPLLGLAVWSLVSSSWGDSADSAWSASGRWLLYASALALLLWWLAGRRHRAQALLTGVAAGVLLVAIWMLFQMLRGHGASLFLGSRLNDPLGYVNGEAGYLLAGAWPCCALAEQRRPAPVAGIGLAGLVLLVALGTLTHSRSWELGLTCSLVVVTSVLPGRRRRAAVLLGGALAILAIHRALGEVSRQPAVGNDVARHAAVAILIASLIAGTGWALVVSSIERIAPASSRRRSQATRLAGVALAVLAVAAAVLIGANARRISHAVSADYHAFVHLAPSPGSARFLSGGGNRYDYWRVAWLEFRSAPLAGVGAGNYQPGYYRHRRTSEAITQPHSLELQTLAELGLVGFALLLAFLIAVGWMIFKAARLRDPDPRVRDPDPRVRFTAVAATGLFVGWLTQTSADWEHLIPGLTLIALAAVAALRTIAGTPREPLRGRPHAYVVGAAVVIALGGAIMIAPRILTLSAQSSARLALQRGHPRAAIVDASRALQYDGTAVGAHVLRAAAFARLGAFVPARADLRQALASQPQNWVTWALLGDLLTRRGDLRGARAAYRRAQVLNPLEPGLKSPAPL